MISPPALAQMTVPAQLSLEAEGSS